MSAISCEGKEGHAFISVFGNPQNLTAYLVCQKCGETRILSFPQPEESVIAKPPVRRIH